jgi:hypothetical protein
VAAAVYVSGSSSVLAWSTLRFPFAAGAENKFQIHREYLGYLFSLILLLAHVRPSSASLLPYRWINDNLGAIAWSTKHRCSSPSSVVACFASSQFHILYPLFLLDSCHLPGVLMGEIDAMSRRENHHDILSVCPSLLPSLHIDLEDTSVVSLFRLCDPATTPPSSIDFHHIYSDVLRTIGEISTRLTPTDVHP